ncbi:MAG TPA: TIGR03016 family PEP-CTERM system-associated outer membrane protein, partial [Burkholderiaceae bacterium]|nr:TIGR03016 family PEP-CTERM system-associated outer membrane protein [Burkholderiaceae bacterium]
NLAEVVQTPAPFGVTVRLTNDLTRIQNQLQPDQTLNAALAIFNYAFTPQFTFGLRGGYENTTYTAVETAGPIYGANLAWYPSPLTSVVGYWEDRFYGPSYQWVASHRQRRVASSLSFYRTISTNPQVLFQIPSTTSTAGLLNAILLGRFPDPVDRAQAINDLMTRQGLPQSLPGGAYVYNQSANVLTGGNANWALIGVRNTLALNLFYLKTAYLPDPRVPPSFLLFNNSIQQGGGVTLSHTLTPVLSLNGGLGTSFTRGFGPTEGTNSRQNTVSVQCNWTMSPRSTAFVGSFYQYQTSTLAVSLANQSQFAIYAGLFHRL